MKNIYLVGFMGTGKSVVGKLLAAKLHCAFIDLDKQIEERSKRKIVDIFAQDGEPYFRLLEKENLQEVVRDADKVVACGGGIVLDPENIETMKSTGWMVALSARPEAIMGRVKDHTHRPLLNVEDRLGKIKEILASRQALYAKAHIIIDTSDLSVDEVAQKVLEYISYEKS